METVSYFTIAYASGTLRSIWRMYRNNPTPTNDMAKTASGFFNAVFMMLSSRGISTETALVQDR
jgi:hypothetical protein